MLDFTLMVFNRSSKPKYIALLGVVLSMFMAVVNAAPFDGETAQEKKMLALVFGEKFVASPPTVRSKMLVDKYLSLVVDGTYFLKNERQAPKIKLEKVMGQQYRVTVSPEQPSKNKKDHIYWPTTTVTFALTRLEFYKEAARYTGFSNINFYGETQLTAHCKLGVKVARNGISMMLIRKKVDEDNGYYAGCDEYYPEWKDVKNQREMTTGWDFWDISWNKRLDDAPYNHWLID
jgi:hypothetical protein